MKQKIKYIKMKMINFVLFLLFFFSSTVSITINDVEKIVFDGAYFSENFTTSEQKYFEIVYESDEKEVENYLKIELVNLDSSMIPNLVIAFSNNDEFCLEREQLSYGLGSTQMWLTKEQIVNRNKYINLICSAKPCSYKLNLEAHSKIELDFDSQFNLYVTENNKKVELAFSSGKEIDESDYITIWAIGNKNVYTSSDDIDQNYKYSKNNIFKINKNTINKSFFTLDITGEVGDIINIGSSSTFTNNCTNLFLNKPEIKGYLRQNYSNEDCYELRKDNTYTSLYLSGIIHSKIAEIYYKNNDGEAIPDSINIIKNGSFIETITPDSKYGDYFCIRFPTSETDNYDITEIFYSLQLTDPSQTQYKIGLYSPQLYGELYPRRLLEGGEYSYIGFPSNASSKQISIDMISQFGFPDMFYRLCKNYPICDEFETEIDSRCINGHSTHKISKYEYKSPMDPRQYILFVKCLGSNNEKSCLFKTAFNSDSDKINLKEDEPFSQYILKGDKDLYKVDYSGEKNIKKIYVDLIVLTGDVNFNIDSNINTKKIYNSNKIFYSIEINEQTSESKEIDFNVLASKNSYYSIEFMFIRENDDSWITNIIEPGISYLVTIDPNAEDSYGNKRPFKIVKFSNLRTDDYKRFLAQFYSLNCKLNITSKRIDSEGKTYYKEISEFDHYYQDIVIKDEVNDYEYILYVKETDSSHYNNKLCMVYSSALELDYNKQLDERQLVISDNEPKQMTFKRSDLKVFEYLYPLSNSANDVIISFNFLDIAIYTVTITFRQNEQNQYKQTGNDIIYLHRNEWKKYCKENEICPIVIKIELTRTYLENEPKLLFSVKSVHESSPIYLTKNQVKLDFLLGENWQYYYTDLGENEEGDVLVSYRRGSGRLYGKIVSKNVDVPEVGATWREMYKFPTTVDESLEFYGYIKKIIIKKNETSICKDGCYLLLSLKTSIESTQPQYDFREHPFSIIIHTRSSDEIEDIPKINIPLREYIIGNLYTHKDDKIYEYYSTIFTHDSNKIIIDFQSKVVNFYINVGVNNKPTRNTEPDFKYESKGQDTIYEIAKQDFLSKCKEKGINIPYENSLLGLGMTIGLWTNKTDSLYTTVYSMKIHLNFDNRMDIYEVKSDQKVLCKTDESKRCLFMVFYLGIDPINHLLLYPLIQNNSPYEMYAKFITQENYEYFDYSYLKANIPNKVDFDYSTEKNKAGHLYIPHGYQYDNFLFVSVVTKEPATVELLTSLYKDDLKLSPNPSSPQLFMVTNDHFLFEFPTSEDLKINIQSVCGEGTIYWEVDNTSQYILQGKSQLISLTNSLIDKSDESKVFSNLYIQNNNQNSKMETCPGFAFYIDYSLRPSEVNLDEIQVGVSNEIAYRNTDFPVYIYAQLKELEKDINLFVNLYELIGGNYSQFSSITPFEINGALVNDSDLMDAKLHSEFLNNLQFDIKGTYDSMIKTGFVLIKKTDIKNKKLDLSDGVNAIIKVTKNPEYSETMSFTRISLETAANIENSSIPIVPNIYQYGKLNLNSEVNIYKLRTDKAGKYMRIHYSPNSQHTKFTISTNPGDLSNSKFKEYSSRFVDGKTVITFDSSPETCNFIYLNIFHNEKQKASNDKTTNYVFKYMNSDNIKNFKLYELSSNEGFQLNSKKNGNKFDYTFTITTLPYQNIDVTYFIKFVKKSDWIDGEGDNCIALRESKSYVEELQNYEVKNKKIIKKYEKINEIDYRYVQIIALVRDKGIIEFVGYKSIYVKDSIVWKIVLIVVAAVVVFIIVLYLIHLYLKKRRNIEGKVEKISGAVVSRISDSPSIE